MSENTKTIGWGHLSRIVAVVTIEGNEFISTNSGLRSECYKCLGAGGFMVYAGLHNGVCYACNGSGLSTKSFADEAAVVKSLRAAERREARRVAKIEAEAAVAMAERDAWVAANADLAARLAEINAEVNIGAPDDYSDRVVAAAHAGAEKYGDFITLMASNASWKALSENMTTAVTEALVDFDARAIVKAEREAAQRHLDATVGDKVTVTGTVVVAMNVDGYAYGSTDRLLVIEGTGDFVGVTFKITGSGATLWETEKGAVVEIAAKVKKFSEYNGTPQTLLTYAKVKTLATA